MFQYLINVTNTLLPTALVVAMLVGFVVSGFAHKRAFQVGLLTGLAAAVILVSMRLKGQWTREYYDLAVLIPLVAAELLFVLTVFIHVFIKRLTLLINLLIFLTAAGLAAYMLPDMFLYPFEFTVGMDNIYNTDFMFKVIGYTLAAGVCLLASLALVRVATRISKGLFVSAIGLMLLLMGAKQMLSMTYILLGRNLIPRSRWVFDIVFFVGDRVQYFMYGLMGIAALLAVLLFIKNKRAVVTGENPAIRRKLMADSLRQRRWCVTLVACLGLALFFITAVAKIADRAIELSPPVEVYAEDGKIVFPLSLFEDNHLHRFVYKTENGINMRFIVIKKPRAGYGVGLDACDVCGPTGYYERKGQVVCILCDVVMNVATIGFQGGCNPVPLAFELAGGNMVIYTSSFAKDEFRFR